MDDERKKDRRSGWDRRQVVETGWPQLKERRKGPMERRTATFDRRQFLDIRWVKKDRRKAVPSDDAEGK
jgi:hypothetical protein